MSQDTLDLSLVCCGLGKRGPAARKLGPLVLALRLSLVAARPRELRVLVLELGCVLVKALRASLLIGVHR